MSASGMTTRFPASGGGGHFARRRLRVGSPPGRGAAVLTQRARLDRPLRFGEDPRHGMLSEPRADEPTRLRIVVADHDALLREGIASLLEAAGHQVVGRAHDAPDLLMKVRSYLPDVAVVDVRMPPGNADDGLVAAVEIRRSQPDVAVLVLSQHLEPAYMLELLGEDASSVGYLLKDRVRDVPEFVAAIERVASGGTALDPGVVNSLVAGRRRSVLDDLTDRERAVLALIAEGRSNRAIARQLHLSARAIERHAQAIFQKLHLGDTEDDNRRVLAVLALLGHCPRRDGKPTACLRRAAAGSGGRPLSPPRDRREAPGMALDLNALQASFDLRAPGGDLRPGPPQGRRADGHLLRAAVPRRPRGEAALRRHRPAPPEGHAAERAHAPAQVAPRPRRDRAGAARARGPPCRLRRSSRALSSGRRGADRLDGADRGARMAARARARVGRRVHHRRRRHDRGRRRRPAGHRGLASPADDRVRRLTRAHPFARTARTTPSRQPAETTPQTQEQTM